MNKLLGLRPYQTEIGRTVLDSVLHGRGRTFTVEIARQGGKNELSAQLEMLLLVLFSVKGGNLVKAAPTFDPQVRISISRLKERLRDAGLAGLWQTEAGSAIRLGRTRQMFLSAEPSSNVVGATAHILLEMDEAQDVDREKFYKEFRPMGASTNVTTVLYGTPWMGDSLLEEMKQGNLEMERADGVKRHFRLDWQEVAQYNPQYQSYVEGERQRLGESHPLFRTQYLLEPLNGSGGLFSHQQLAQLQGRHRRLSRPEQGQVYVAGIDVAGEASEAEGRGRGAVDPDRDSTVVTIGELDFSRCDDLSPEPVVRIVEHYRWTGESHASLFPRLVDLLRDVWRCRRVVVDATGLGQGVASFLEKAMSKGGRAPLCLHVPEQVPPGLRPAGRGELRAAEDVHPGRLAGVPGVSLSDGAGARPFQSKPDYELLRGSRAGSRRLPVKHGPAGEGGRLSAAPCPRSYGYVS